MGAMFDVGYFPPNTPLDDCTKRNRALLAAFAAEPRVGYKLELRSTHFVSLAQISQV
jgi:hypothetical protein